MFPALRYSGRRGSICGRCARGFPTPAMGCPHHCGLLWLGVRLRSSSRCFVGRRRAARGALGYPTLVFVSLRRRGVSHVRVGLPVVSWGALRRYSSPFVVKGLRRLALGSVVIGCSFWGSPHLVFRGVCHVSYLQGLSHRRNWAEGGQYTL